MFDALDSPYTVTINATHDGVAGKIQFQWTVKKAALVINTPSPLPTNTEGDVLSGATALTITSPNADANSLRPRTCPPA